VVEDTRRQWQRQQMRVRQVGRGKVCERGGGGGGVRERERGGMREEVRFKGGNVW